ncbi:MAG: WhiB family transcriptional regulator [Schaalia hyovaginalis]|uniref:WhiB family transcriptional regulator n=1 Tax=Schaalia hyovaginalis TaxID=29316 RepID=UPI0012B3A077|nr:WhiB family transcriptional regulator [Schaalia hyovaginalis]MDY4263015.1 WhiB family transcriptional regulator [Schaalia hyovaginalis]MDY6213671.1 WhiB family transcriptional regulator [Schaalia hyovaginalis]MST64180.1 hypothetical protein [Schaalia hyovaginalis]
MNASTASIRIAGPRALALDALTRDAALAGTPCAEDFRFIDDDPRIQAEAARECAACPVLVQCAAYGRAYRLERGVYGAMTFHQRNGPTRAA